MKWQTWHKLGLFPQVFQVLSDEPAECSSAGMFFVIQNEVVLHKHLMVCLTRKYNSQKECSLWFTWEKHTEEALPGPTLTSAEVLDLKSENRPGCSTTALTIPD